MNKLKNKNGITLVALIITIIVLLILAMVSISLVMNSGIINKSKTAVDKYSQEEVQEQIKLAYSEWQMGQYTGETRTAAEFMQAKLNSIYGTGAVTNVTETNGTFEVTFANGKGYSYNVSTGTTEKVAKWNDNGNNTFTHSETGQTVEVGDTVYYNSGVAAYEGEGASQGKWGILGVENGKLLIMSKENVASVTLEGKQGYLNGSTLLNNACSSFKNPTYADSVRSVKVEDINKITGYTPADPVTYTYTMVNGKVKRNDQTSASSTTKFEDINGKTLPTDSPIEVTVNSYSYSLTNYLTSGNKVHNLLKDNNNYYWLDSPYVYANTGSAHWGFRSVGSGGVNDGSLWGSHSGAYGYSDGVRAVVSLKSDIQLSESSSEGWTIQ